MTRLRMVVSVEIRDNGRDGASGDAAPALVYYFVREGDDGVLTLQELNENHVPSGEKKTIGREALMKEYLPEPEMYLKEVIPAMEKLAGAIRRGEENLADGMLESAEWEFDGALSIDGENVQATFGLGQTYIEMGEPEKADIVFGKLLELAEAFHPRHKHLFNRYGIALRRSRMLDQAEAYYTKALYLSTGDENLHFNVARVYFDQQRFGKAREHLEQALEINGTFEAAGQFLNVCLRAEGKPLRSFARPGTALERDGGTVAHSALERDGGTVAHSASGPPPGAPDGPPDESHVLEPLEPGAEERGSVLDLENMPDQGQGEADPVEPGPGRGHVSDVHPDEAMADTGAMPSDQDMPRLPEEKRDGADGDAASLESIFSDMDDWSFDAAFSGGSLKDILEKELDDETARSLPGAEKDDGGE